MLVKTIKRVYGGTRGLHQRTRRKADTNGRFQFRLAAEKSMMAQLMPRKSGKAGGHMLGTLQNIRFFVAAYEEGSFTAAAVREHSTQPGISHHVRQLETVLNVQLFMRNGGSVEPTPAGHTYYNHCREVLRAHDAATRAMRPFSGAEAERITVALVPSITRAAVAPALKRFMERRPNVTVHVIEGHGESIVPMASRDDISFVICQQMPGVTGLRTRKLFESPDFLVSRKDLDQPRLAPLDIRKLPPLKLVWASHSNPHRQMVERFVREANVRVAETLELDSIAGMLELVRSSDWRTILPAVMMRPDDMDMFSLNTVEPTCSFPMFLQLPAGRQLSMAEDELVDDLVAVSFEILEEWERCGSSIANIGLAPLGIEIAAQ
jgi:DNA-binding transcriptional LysR family regulator